MRDLINLVEAARRGKPAVAAPAPVDPVAQAQALYNKALDVAKSWPHQRWDKAWATLLSAMLQQARQQHDADQAEEAAYQSDLGEEYTAKPFAVLQALPDVLNALWDEVAPTCDLVDGVAHAYRYYRAFHPRTEMSDELTLLDGQRILAHKVSQGGLGDVASMERCLTALESYLFDIKQAPFAAEIGTQETCRFVALALPLILTVAKLMGAHSAA